MRALDDRGWSVHAPLGRGDDLTDAAAGVDVLVIATPDEAIAKLKATTTDTARIQLTKVNAKWMREFIDYDPEPAMRATKTPLLAITGTKDVQVDAEDLEEVALVVGDRAEVWVIDDLDHILRYEPEPVSNPKKYKRQIERPIDGRVITALTDWLARFETDAVELDE